MQRAWMLSDDDIVVDPLLGLGIGDHFTGHPEFTPDTGFAETHAPDCHWVVIEPRGSIGLYQDFVDNNPGFLLQARRLRGHVITLPDYVTIIERQKQNLYLHLCDDTSQCSICLDDCCTQTQCCRAAMHRSCLLIWLQVSETCPYCRSDTVRGAQDVIATK